MCQHYISLTSHTVPVVVVHVLDLPVSKRQLAHPVDTPAHARREAEVAVGGGGVESI